MEVDGEVAGEQEAEQATNAGEEDAERDAEYEEEEKELKRLRDDVEELKQAAANRRKRWGTYRDDLRKMWEKLVQDPDFREMAFKRDKNGYTPLLASLKFAIETQKKALASKLERCSRFASEYRYMGTNGLETQVVDVEYGWENWMEYVRLLLDAVENTAELLNVTVDVPFEFEKHSKPTNPPEGTGLGLLHIAAQNRHPELIEFLCSLGANPNLQDTNFKYTNTSTNNANNDPTQLFYKTTPLYILLDNAPTHDNKPKVPEKFKYVSSRSRLGSSISSSSLAETTQVDVSAGDEASHAPPRGDIDKFVDGVKSLLKYGADPCLPLGDGASKPGDTPLLVAVRDLGVLKREKDEAPAGTNSAG
ncbi:hypothetical protein HK102_010784, partial [Quaeritorhiza haematococci]